jgi:hypothetical protein
MLNSGGPQLRTISGQKAWWTMALTVCLGSAMGDKQTFHFADERLNMLLKIYPEWRTVFGMQAPKRLFSL